MMKDGIIRFLMTSRLDAIVAVCNHCQVNSAEIFLMSNPDVDLKVSHNIICNHCRNNIAEIFQESGEFCLHCWQEKTYPNI